MLALLITLTCGAIFTGCCVVPGGDTTYRFVFESQRSDTVAITAPSVWEGELVAPACSVRDKGGGGVPYGSPIKIVVRDRAGEVVYTTTVKADLGGTGNSFYIIIPGNGPRQCPASAATYVVTVWNHQHSPVEVLFRSASVGVVKPSGSVTFGPFPGSWRDTSDVMIRDAQGAQLVGDRAVVDHNLGEVPEVAIAVDDWSR